MNNKCALAVVEVPDCFLCRLIRGGGGVRVRVLRVVEEEGRIKAWLSVRGPREAVRDFLKGLSGVPGASFTVIRETQTSRLVYVTLPASHCELRRLCPTASPNGRLYPLSAMIVRGKMLLLAAVSSRKTLQEIARSGLKVLGLVEGEEHDDMTPQQEEVLSLAYRMGYYRYPRGACLRDIARAAGLSVSTVAEKLRKAEAKAVGKYILEEVTLVEYAGGGG